MTAVQELPDSTRDYRRFPRKRIPAGFELFRAHSPRRGAWWFDDSPHGRFNLRDGRGTCYVATRVETAVRERVRDAVSSTNVVSPKLAQSFTVSVVNVPDELTSAAVSASRAVVYGVVRALVTMADYSIPQKWARTLRSNGFGGIYYGSAYTTGGPSALALFGDRGAPGGRFATRSYATGAEGCQAAGMTVIGPPGFGALTVI